MGYDCVDPHRVAIWPAAFLAKGGLEALLRVYGWLATSFTSFASSETRVEAGQGSHGQGKNGGGGGGGGGGDEASIRDKSFHGPGSITTTTILTIIKLL